MNLRVLYESVEDFDIHPVRDVNDLKKLAKLSKEWGIRGKFPNISTIKKDIVLTARRPDGEIVGYSITKPYQTTAYNRSNGTCVHPDFRGILEKSLISAMQRVCQELGFKYNTMNTKDNCDWTNELFGDPVTRKSNKMKVHRWRKDLSEPLAGSNQDVDMQGDPLDECGIGPPIKRRGANNIQGGGYA